MSTKHKIRKAHSFELKQKKKKRTDKKPNRPFIQIES